jgi:hypothetical protein
MQSATTTAIPAARAASSRRGDPRIEEAMSALLLSELCLARQRGQDRGPTLAELNYHQRARRLLEALALDEEIAVRSSVERQLASPRGLKITAALVTGL